MRESLIRSYKLASLEKVLSVILLILGGGMLYMIHISTWFSSTKSVINNPGFFPQIVAIGFLMMCAVLFVSSMKKERNETVTINWFGVLIVFVWLGFAVLCSTLGFILSGIIVLFATFLLFGAKNKKAIILTSILAPTVLYLMLGVMLGVKLPTLFL